MWLFYYRLDEPTRGEKVDIGDWRKCRAPALKNRSFWLTIRMLILICVARLHTKTRQISWAPPAADLESVTA